MSPERRVDEFIPVPETAQEMVEFIDRLRENELLDFLDTECYPDAKTANKKILGIEAHYNNLIQAVLNGVQLDIVLNKIKNENRKK